MQDINGEPHIKAGAGDSNYVSRHSIPYGSSRYGVCGSVGAARNVRTSMGLARVDGPVGRCHRPVLAVIGERCSPCRLFQQYSPIAFTLVHIGYVDFSADLAVHGNTDSGASTRRLLPQ